VAGTKLTLTVRANGIRIRKTGRRGGLANLAKRAAALGGTLDIGPAEGGGTELIWQVPMHTAPQLALRILLPESLRTLFDVTHRL